MWLLAAGKEFSFSISDKYIHRSVVLVVQAPLWFVPGEVIRGRQAGSLFGNGFGILGCSDHSPNRGSTDPGNSSSSRYPARDGERLAVMVQSR